MARDEQKTDGAEVKSAPMLSKTIGIEEFMVTVQLSKTVKDYVNQYLTKKVGFKGTASKYKQVLEEFLNKKQ